MGGTGTTLRPAPPSLGLSSTLHKGSRGSSSPLDSLQTRIQLWPPGQGQDRVAPTTS